MIRYFLCGLILAGFVSPNSMVYGEGEKPDNVMVQSDQLTWKAGPASLRQGAQFAVLEGNPSAPEEFTMRLKVPADYKILPHWHPAIEHVSVISGSFIYGAGRKIRCSQSNKVGNGGLCRYGCGDQTLCVHQGGRRDHTAAWDGSVGHNVRKSDR